MHVHFNCSQFISYSGKFLQRVTQDGVNLPQGAGPDFLLRGLPVQPLRGAVRQWSGSYDKRTH